MEVRRRRFRRRRRGVDAVDGSVHANAPRGAADEPVPRRRRARRRLRKRPRGRDRVSIARTTFSAPFINAPKHRFASTTNDNNTTNELRRLSGRVQRTSCVD